MKRKNIKYNLQASANVLNAKSNLALQRRFQSENGKEVHQTVKCTSGSRKVIVSFLCYVTQSFVSDERSRADRRKCDVRDPTVFFRSVHKEAAEFWEICVYLHPSCSSF